MARYINRVKKIVTQESILIPKQYGIRIVETPELNPAYISQRDTIWTEKVEAGRKVGKEFFNGVLYRLMGVENESSPEPVLKLGHMTYADRIMKSNLSVDEIERLYGKDHVMVHCCVDAILTTTDGKVVYGVKKRSVDLKEGKLGFVSGNMNADEVKVNAFEDIFTMVMKEIGEETSIVPDRKKLSFAMLGVSNGWASFYFLYKLGIHSRDIGDIYKDDEFQSFEAMFPVDILRESRVATSDFNYSKGFLLELDI